MARLNKASPSDIAEMVADLKDELESFHSFDERIEHAIESKLYELKAVSYITLLLVTALLAIVIGILFRAIGY